MNEACVRSSVHRQTSRSLSDGISRICKRRSNDNFTCNLLYVHSSCQPMRACFDPAGWLRRFLKNQANPVSSPSQRLLLPASSSLLVTCHPANRRDCTRSLLSAVDMLLMVRPRRPLAIGPAKNESRLKLQPDQSDRLCTGPTRTNTPGGATTACGDDEC